MKFWFLQPDYQHHKNRLLNIGMLAGNKNKTIVELDSNQHNSYLVAPPLFERQAVVRLFFCVFFSSICRQILCLFSGFLDFFFKWMAMRWRSREFWFLVLGGFVTQGTIVLDGLIGLRVGTAHPFWTEQIVSADLALPVNEVRAPPVNWNTKLNKACKQNTAKFNLHSFDLVKGALIC